MTEKALPTKASIWSTVNDFVDSARVTDSIVNELAALGVVFAPEPTPEPASGKLITDSEGEVWQRHADGYWYELVALGRRFKWAEMRQPTETLLVVDTPEPAPAESVVVNNFYVEDEPLERANEAYQNGQKVTTRKPAPKYTATRAGDGWLEVDMFLYNGDRVFLAHELARIQAALDLLDREAGE